MSTWIIENHNQKLLCKLLYYRCFQTGVMTLIWDLTRFFPYYTQEYSASLGTFYLIFNFFIYFKAVFENNYSTEKITFLNKLTQLTTQSKFCQCILIVI